MHYIIYVCIHLCTYSIQPMFRTSILSVFIFVFNLFIYVSHKFTNQRFSYFDRMQVQTVTAAFRPKTSNTYYTINVDTQTFEFSALPKCPIINSTFTEITYIFPHSSG